MAKGRAKPPIRELAPGQKGVPGISMRQERYIGRVVAAWSSLEAAMEDVIWVLLQVPIDDGRIFTSRADATRKLQWLRALAKRHAIIDGLDEILNLIESRQDDRNFIAHGTWLTMFPDNNPACASIRAKGPPGNVVVETFPDFRMREITGDILRARDALVAWRDMLEASREKSPLPSPDD